MSVCSLQRGALLPESHPQPCVPLPPVTCLSIPWSLTMPGSRSVSGVGEGAGSRVPTSRQDLYHIFRDSWVLPPLNLASMLSPRDCISHPHCIYEVLIVTRIEAKLPEGRSASFFHGTPWGVGHGRHSLNEESQSVWDIGQVTSHLLACVLSCKGAGK